MNKRRVEKDPSATLTGIFLEIKDGEMYRTKYGPDFEISKHVLDTLSKYNLSSRENASKACPIVLMSFDVESVKYFKGKTDLELNQLIGNWEKGNLSEIAKYADAIGPDIIMLFENPNTYPGKFNKVVEDAHKLNLKVYPWTFRNDKLPAWAKTPEEMYFLMKNQSHVDGVTTEFPDFVVGCYESPYSLGSELQHLSILLFPLLILFLLL